MNLEDHSNLKVSNGNDLFGSSLQQKITAIIGVPLNETKRKKKVQYVGKIPIPENPPYKCTICNHESCNKQSLAKHISVVHLKIKPFACPHCDWKFGAKTAMKEHVYSIHEKQNHL